MATPTDDTDYSCHTKAVELVEPIILGPNHATSCHITPLIIKALGTDTHIQTSPQKQFIYMVGCHRFSRTFNLTSCVVLD